MKKILRDLMVVAQIGSATVACNNSLNSTEGVADTEETGASIDDISDNITTQIEPIVDPYIAELKKLRVALMNQGINIDQYVTIFEDTGLSQEERELALRVLQSAENIQTLDRDKLLRLSVYSGKIDWMENWRRASADAESRVNQHVDASLMLQEFTDSPEATQVDADQYLDIVNEACRDMERHFPVEHLELSLRQFLRFSPEMVIALTVEEHSDPTFVAARAENRGVHLELSAGKRIELLRLLLNSGYNPFLVIPRGNTTLPFGVLQNTPSSTDFEDLQRIWASPNFTEVRSPDIESPFTGHTFVDLFDPNDEAYKLQIITTLTKIINRLHLQSRRAFLGEESDKYLEFIARLRNGDENQNERFALVMAAIVQASSAETADNIIRPVLLSEARNAEEAIAMILGSPVLVNNEILNRYVNSALESFDILQSGNTGFTDLGNDD